MAEQHPTEGNPEASAMGDEPEMEPQHEYQEASGGYSQTLPVTQPQQEYPEASGGDAAADDSKIVPVSQFYPLQQELIPLRSQLFEGPVATIRTNVTTICPGNMVYIKTDQASTRTRDTDHRRMKLQGHMSEVIRKDDEVFVETSGYQSAKECLESQRYVSIVGRPGSGKTSMAYHLLRHYKRQKYDVLILVDPKDLRHDRKPGVPTLLLIDDIFGSVSFSPQEFQKWQQLLDTELLPLLVRPSCNVKAIFTSRGYIYQEARSYLTLMSCFDENVIIDLSVDMFLVREERLAILTKHQELSNFKMSSELMEKICDVECSHGFPHVCKLFFTFHQFHEDPVEFFENPLPCLQNTIRKMEKINPEKYAAMVLVVLNNNRVNVQSLNQDDEVFQRLHKIVTVSSFDRFFQNRFEIFRSMLAGFLKNDGDTFSFLHPSIHDTVAYLIGVRNPAFVIENTSAVFLFERIKIHLDDRKKFDKGTREDLSSFTILLSEDWYPLLSKQFAKLILSGDISLVCSHQSLQSERFITLVFDFLEEEKGSMLPDFISSVRDQQYQKTFLYWSTWSQSSALTNFILSKFIFSDESKYEAAISCCLSGNEDSFIEIASTLPVDTLSRPRANQEEVPTLKKPKEDFPDSELNFAVDLFKNKGKELENVVLLAAKYGRMKIVKWLLEEKRAWAIDGSNLFGDTLLQKSCLSGNIKLIRYLLDHDVDKKQPNMLGMTPLHYACTTGNTQVVKLLLLKPDKSVNGMKQRVSLKEISKDESLEESQHEKSTDNRLYGLEQFVFASETGNTKLMLLEFNKTDEKSSSSDYSSSSFHAKPVVISSMEDLVEQDERDDHKTNAESMEEAVEQDKMDDHTTSAESMGEAVEQDKRDDHTTNAESMDVAVEQDERDDHTNSAKSMGFGSYEDSVKEVLDNLILAETLSAESEKLIMIKESIVQSSQECTGKHKSPAYIDIQTKGGLTPLMFACMYGHKRVVELLLEYKANINLTENDGYTALMLPCLTGHHRMVSLLAQHGADVNVQNKKGNCGLFLACGNDHLRVVEELLRFGANSNLQNEDNGTALLLACEKSNVEIAETLLKHGALATLSEKHNQTPLHTACKHGNVKLAKTLLEHKQDLEVRGQNDFTALTLACQHNHREILELLLHLGADVNASKANGDTPLMIASDKGYTKEVEILLKAGADVNIQNDEGVTSLMYACCNGYEQIVSMLITKGANVIAISRKGITPLLLACQHRHKNIAHKLLKEGAWVDIPSEDGVTPLIAACEMSDKETASLLLQYEADVTARKEDGHTALLFACQNGPLDLVELLIKHGADVNVRSANGLTPLILASAKSQEEIVDVLLRNNALVNAYTDDGLTALQIAAENGHADITRTLLNAGADVTLMDNRGRTALSLAVIFKRMNVVKELLKHYPESYLKTDSIVEDFITSCKMGQGSIVEIFLQQKVDVNAFREDKTTPLLHAACHGYPDVAEKLLVHGANIDTADQNGHTPIFIASDKGHRNLVDILLRYDADVNITNSRGSPLLAACLGNHQEVAEMLLKHGADANFKGDTYSPLEYVVSTANFEFADLLLRHGASPNIATDDDLIPLIIACRAGNNSLVTLLLRNKANPNGRLSSDLTPLIIAAEKNLFDMVSTLISFNANVNASASDGLTPLLIASEYGFADIAYILCAHSADVNTMSSVNNVTPMMIASQEGHVDVINVLLKYGGSINCRGSNRLTPLCTATDNNHLDVVKKLLEQNVDVNAQAVEGTTALYLAVQNENEPITDILLQRGADVNIASSTGATPFIVACSKNNIALVEMLLQNNADVNRKTTDGATPLYFASYFGSEYIVCRLLEHGASSSINTQDKGGLTPLTLACIGCHEKIVQYLLEAGSNPKLADVKGNTSLHWACNNSNIKVVEAILQSKELNSVPSADCLQQRCIVNTRDYHGSSPLLIASEFGHTEQVRMLLEHGADVNAADDDGDTALFLACNKGYSEIVDILMKHKAKVDVTNLSGESPLEAARSRGDEEMVRRLLAKEEEALVYVRF